MVATPPIPPGINTSGDKLPMPSTKGVYRPKGISRVEKLIPGAIILKARQKPQNTYQTNPGLIVTLKALRLIKREKTIIMAVNIETKDLLVRP